jgi:hypothetical protein
MKEFIQKYPVMSRKQLMAELKVSRRTLGRLRAQAKVPAGSISAQLAIGHLPPGTYFLHAQAGGHAHVQRVVKR